MILLFLSTALAATQRFALVAGANDGGPGRVHLRYAVSDAEAVGAVLTQLGGVAPADLRMLTEPKREQVLEGLDWLRARSDGAAQKGDRTEVFVYYSGHSDEEGLRLGGTEIGYSELRGALDLIHADVRVMVLDSCASGALILEKGGAHLPPFLIDESTDVSGYAYLTSSSMDEVAQEGEQVQGSYFTHFFVSGLRGAADLSSDRRVTLNEAYQFAYAETLARTERTVGGAQHPAYDIRLSGSGDLVMTELVTTGATLQVDPALEGRLFLRDAEGRLVVEMAKDAGRAVDLGLAPGVYTALVNTPQGLYEARVELKQASTTTLRVADLRPTKATLASARGGEMKVVPVSLGVIPDFWDPDPELHHLDLSLGIAEADALNGLQLALVAAIARDQARGLQASSGVNVAGRLDGAQLGVALNVAKTMRGLQASSGVNVLGVGSGAQLAAGVNVAQDLRGAQIGDINVAGTVEGAQVGVINIADGVGGQVGVLNIARDASGPVLGVVSVNLAGYNSLQLWASESDAVRLSGTYGGRRLYSLAELGWSPDRYTTGLGLGLHSPVGRWFVDVDATALSYTADFRGDSGLITRARGVVGYSLGPVALFAGPTFNLQVLDGDPGDYAIVGLPTGHVGELPAWFGGSVGLRLARPQVRDSEESH